MFNGDFMTVEELKDFIDSRGEEILKADVYFRDWDGNDLTVDLAEITIDSDGEALFFLR